VYTRSAGQELRLELLRPNPHSEEILIAILPKHSILFGADLLDLDVAEGTLRRVAETRSHYALRYAS
jgi:hypothetical protein